MHGAGFGGAFGAPLQMSAPGETYGAKTNYNNVNGRNILRKQSALSWISESEV